MNPTRVRAASDIPPPTDRFSATTEAVRVNDRRSGRKGPFVATTVQTRPMGRADPAALVVQDLAPDDLQWADDALERELGGRHQARRGELIDVLDEDGLVAWRDGGRVGLLTYRPDGDGRTELSALFTLEPGTGVGSALVRELVRRVRASRGREIRVTTTNDNVTALAFYQRLGFRLVELRAGAVDGARASLKPSIPDVAANGIPFRDELELALDL